ncbi:MAG: NADH-quinone oxidoreductase subunit L [Deltaproteobacteria bacterium]|nr:NADH-quinone oxidoreductase subunit L [Deltaproteobacteria bacterium]
MPGLNEISLRPGAPDQYWLLLPIVLLPALGALVNGLFGSRLKRDTIHTLACAMVFTSFALSVVAFLQLAALPHEARHLTYRAYEWFTVTLPAAFGSAQDYRIPIDVAFRLDPLAATMLLVVTGVGSLIHLYSTGYMAHDESPGRFFSYMNLFTFAMLVLVLGESLPVMFVGWEGVGLCSYLLIGFWFDKDENAKAGMKAFIVNRIGDLGFLVGIFLLALSLGVLSFPEMEQVAAHAPTQLTKPAFDLSFSLFGWDIAWRPAIATIAAICLFVGAAGKSAQLPLYVWLPDAMAGPTPVSALIHAATMVTAGVYMVARMHFLFVLTASGMAVVAVTGALTAVFAATIALTQNDIKKVLAYSTVSQLGYMFVAVGVGAHVTGVFHVVTHAFFKACLFLGAGSVIVAMHHRQDIREMGGLKALMPRTRWTFLAATLAIAGFPFTSGFFSKDAILWHALARDSGRYGILPPILLTLLLAGAALTAFYMFRLYFLVFGGESRADEDTLAHIKESPSSMTLPLVVLGALSIAAGLLNPEALHALGLNVPLTFEGWLAPGIEEGVPAVGIAEMRKPFELPLVGASSVIALAAMGFAWIWYRRGPSAEAERLAARVPGLYALVLDKWRIDELYEATIVRSLRWLARAGHEAIDKLLIDGIMVHGVAGAVNLTGRVVRLVQTGRVQVYAMAMALGTLGILYKLAVPSTDFEARVDGRSVTVNAAEGAGYEYRWDFDGDGRWDTQFGAERRAEHRYRKAGRHEVRLEVRNAFTRSVGEHEVVVRPGRRRR